MKNNINKVKDIKVALIGCGAVAEQFHLPALKKIKANVSCCIDLDINRATHLANKLKSNPITDYDACINDFNVAIISLPHNLHATISIDLLKKGKHVLVEKPMAISVKECDEMIVASKKYNKILAIGNFRRNYYNTAWLKKNLNASYLGDVEEFYFKDGGVYSWPVTTDSFWNIQKSGGGVLIDTGAHTIDQLLYLLGDASVLDYKDDSFGGPEADCIFKLKMNEGSIGTVELSRTADIGSEAYIKTSKHEITMGLTNHSLEISNYDSLNVNNKLPSFKSQSYLSLFSSQLLNWFDGIINGGDQYVSGEEAKKTVEIINSCYFNREKLIKPWL